MKRCIALILALVLSLGLLPATAFAADPVDIDITQPPDHTGETYPEATMDSTTGLFLQEDGFYQIRNEIDFLRAMEMTEHDTNINMNFALVTDLDLKGLRFREAYLRWVELNNDQSEIDKDDELLNFGTPDHPYQGHFYGNGHTIRNVTNQKSYANPKANTGLFNTTGAGVIRDLNLDNFNIVSTYMGGLLVGHSKGTKILNVTIANSNFRVEPGNNVLVIGGDGGAYGGGLVGWADDDTVLYNCGTKDTNVRINNTMGVGALSGKGLYVGGLVGWADNSLIEYCRCERTDLSDPDKAKVSNYYDVAIGALGGYKIYSGGLVGRLDASQVTDCFATNHVYFYCATYVSVGGGNSGFGGGIAAVTANGSTITRSHFAGTLESQQYNAVLVIPVIQNNVNLSGLVQTSPTQLKVNDSFFLKDLVSGIKKVGVAGSSEHITGNSGPQSGERYADRAFWESHGYDFMGSVDIPNVDISYRPHQNKWVMDKVKNGPGENDYITIPVHGKSSSATFDFPGGGEVKIESMADVALHKNDPSVTADPYNFARLAMYPNEGQIVMKDNVPVSVGDVNLTFTANPGYRFVDWYRDAEVGATGVSRGDDTYFKTLRSDDKNKAGLTNAGTLPNALAKNVATYDNDLFMAHVEGKVTFHDLAKAEINVKTGSPGGSREDDWYDYRTPLPQVEPTNTAGVGTGAKLIGWTTDTAKPYGAITSAELKGLKDKGDFFQTGEPIEKTMELYPVYANLALNAQVQIEGHDAGDPYTRTGVGKVSTSTDEGGNVVLKVSPESGDQFPEGYRFLGWYEVTGDTAYRLSTQLEHTLVGVDLTEEHTYEARFEYLVDYYVHALDSAGSIYEKSDPVFFTSRWHKYDQELTPVKGPDYYRVTFTHWGAEPQRDLDVLGEPYTGPITQPQSVYAQDTKSGGSVHIGTSLTGTTDFPGGVDVILPEYSGATTSGYVFEVEAASQYYHPVFYTREAHAHGTHAGLTQTSAELHNDPADSLTYKSEKMTMDTMHVRLLCAHVVADVIFHQVDPATGADTPATVTRRYDQQVFLDSDTTTTYTYLDPANPVEGREHVAAASPAARQYPGYYFVGWVDADSLTAEEKAYVFQGGDPTKGIGTTLERATPYLLKEDAVVRTAMPNVYPVYLPYDITTRTTVALEVENVVFKPSDPDFTPKPQSQEQVEITLTAYDKQPVDNTGKLTYTLTAITVSENGGEPVELAVTDKGEREWKVKYTVKPGVRYVFTAVYLPYVVVFHRNGDLDATVLVRNHGDTVGEMVYASAHTARPWQGDLDDTLFVGWTPDAPADPVDKPYFKVDNATYTDKEALLGAVKGYKTVAETSAMIVTQSQELWPVYAQYSVNVTSNLDDHLPAGYTKEQIRMAQREQEMNKDGLHVELYAADLYQEGYRFDGWYLNGEQITDQNTYKLSGEEPFAGNTYEARYTEVFRIVYHGVEAGNETDGPNILHVTELSAGELNQKLVNQETVLVPKTENGKPVLDANGNLVMEEKLMTVPLDPEPEAKLQEQLGVSKVLAQWMWVKDGNAANNQHYSKLTDTLDAYLGHEAGKVTEMHLYPRLWTLTVLDADGREISLDGSGQDKSVTAGLDIKDTAESNGDHLPEAVSVYFNPAKPYTGQKLTVKVERNTWTGNAAGDNATKVINGIPEVPVTLYTTPEVPQGQDTPPKFAEPKNTDANGVAEFALNIPLDDIDGTKLNMYTVEVGNDTVNAAVPADKTLNKSAGGVYISFPASEAETKYTGAVKGYQLFVYKTGSATPVARKEITAGDTDSYNAATKTYVAHIPAATSGMVPTTGAADGAVYTVSVTAKPAAASYKDSQAVQSTAPVAGGRVELTTANLAGPKGTTGDLDGAAVFPTVTFDNTNKDVAVSYKVATNPPLPTTENAGAMTVRYTAKDTATAATPKDAGDYDVYVSTAGGSYYLPLAETKVGTFKIEKSTTGGVDINIPVPGTPDDPATPDVDESKPGRPAEAGDENPSYTVETVWKDHSDTVVNPDAPVKPGETYTAEVTLTPKNGYQFPADPATDLDLTINGAEPTGHTVTKEGETVKIVYTFPATKPATPVITVGAESFCSGKVAKITTQSAQEVKLFYYGKTTEDAMLPSAVEAAATKRVTKSPAAGTTDVVWDNTDAAAMTTLSPNTTYYVFAVAKVGDTYSEVAKASFKTPYRVTVAAGEGADTTAGKMDENLCKDYSLYAEGESAGNALVADSIPETMTVTAIPAEGYAFKVWTTSNDDGGERAAEAPLAEVTWDAAELVYTIQPNSKRHITLTATFEPIYHVVYDPNGGTVAGGSLPEDTTVYKRADKITVQALAEGVTLEKEGYTFEGWTGEPDPNEGVRVFKPGEFIKMSDVVERAKLNPGDTFTLYAVWKAKELKFNEAGSGNPIDIGQGKTNEHNMGPDVWTGYDLSGLVTGGTGDYTYEMVRLATGNYPDFLGIGTINDSGTNKPAIVLNTRLGCAKDYTFGVKITDQNSKKSVQGVFTLTVTPQTPVINSFTYDSGAGNVPGTAVVNKTKIKAKVVDKYQADKVLYDSTGTETNTSGGVWVADPATFLENGGTAADYTFKFQVTGEHAGDFNEASDDTKAKVSLTAASKETDVAITDETDGTTGMSMDYHKTVTVKYGYDAIPAVTVTVNNTGTTSNLNLAITSDNADFVVSPDTASVNVGGKATFTMTVPQGKPVGTHTAKVTVVGTDPTDSAKTVTGTYTYELIVEPAEISAALVSGVTAPASRENAIDPTVADNDGYTVTYKWTETGKTEAVTAFGPGVSYTVSATFTAAGDGSIYNYKFVEPAGDGYQLQLTGADAPVTADQSDSGEANYAISADGHTLTISKTFKALAPDNVTAQVKPEHDQITLEKMSGESGRRLDFYYLVVEVPEGGVADMTAEEIKQYVVDPASRTLPVKLSGLAHGREPVGGVSTWDGTAAGNSTFKALDLEPNTQYKVLVAALAPEDGDMAVGSATAPTDTSALGPDGRTVTTPKALTVSASQGGTVKGDKHFTTDDTAIQGGTEQTISIHVDETFTAKAKAAGVGWAFLHWDVDGAPKAEAVPGLKNESTYEYVHAEAADTSTLRAHFVKKLSGELAPSGTPQVGGTVTIDPNGITIGDKVYTTGKVSDMMQEEKIEILWQYNAGTDESPDWQPITRQDGQQNADGTTYAKGLQWKVWEGPEKVYLGKEIRAQLTYTYMERGAELAKSDPVYAAFTDKVTKKLDKPAISVSPAATDPEQDVTGNKGGLDVTVTPPADAPDGTGYVVKVIDPANPDNPVREIITTGTKVNIPLVGTPPYSNLDPTKEYKIEVVAKPPAGSGYTDSDPATATKDAKGGKLSPAKIPITLADLDLKNITDTAKGFNDRIQDAKKEGLDIDDPLVSLKGALSGVTGLTVNVYYNPGNTVTEGQRHVGEYPIHVEVTSTNPLYEGSDGVIDTGKTLTITQDKPTLKLNPPTAGVKRAELFNLGSVAVTATLSKPTPAVPLGSGEHYADLNGVITGDRFTYRYVIKSVPAGYTSGAYTVGQELEDGFITPDDFGNWEIWVQPRYNGIAGFEADVALPDDGVFTLVVGRRVATAVTLENIGDGKDIDNVITYGTSGKGYDASTAEKAKTWPLKGIKATFTYEGSDTPETITSNDKGEFLPKEGGEKLGVTWTVERGSATVKDGAVHFTTAGNITLKLSYMNASTTVDLTVSPRKVTGWHTTSDGKQTGGTKVYEAGNKSVPKPGMDFDAGVVLAGDDLNLSGLVDSDYELTTDEVGEADITVKDPTKVKLTGAQFGLYDLTGANRTWGKLTIQKKNDGGSHGGGSSSGGGTSAPAPVPAPETKHSWYMKGYPDGSFAPDAKITRAEVATVIARSCLTGFVEGKNYGNPGHYADIQGHWAASAISFCTSKKVFEGRGDGTFDPDKAITREELALVVARLQGVQKAGKLPFTDAADIDSWALDGVYTAYAEGWIIGYEDGSFQPRRDIARCETVKIINGYLKRKVDAKGLLSDHHHWPDVASNHWAYYEIAEATHSHEFSRKNDKTPETWTEIK